MIRSIISPDRLEVLEYFVKRCNFLEGDIWECGVYKGGSAKLIADNMFSSGHLRLFDTFNGMPDFSIEGLDDHKKGDFKDTNLPDVANLFISSRPIVHYHQGMMPETFIGLEHSKISFAHIDVDLYQSVKDCIEFIWPRLTPGGVMLFDDYGFAMCKGAKKAIDECMLEGFYPLRLTTGQALVMK